MFSLKATYFFANIVFILSALIPCADQTIVLSGSRLADRSLFNSVRTLGRCRRKYALNAQSLHQLFQFNLLFAILYLSHLLNLSSYHFLGHGMFLYIARDQYGAHTHDDAPEHTFQCSWYSLSCLRNNHTNDVSACSSPAEWLADAASKAFVSSSSFSRTGPFMRLFDTSCVFTS